MKRILVIEDKPGELALIGDIVKSLGHEPELVHDGAMAMPLLEQNTYALVVTDLLMPGSTGFEVIARMRTHNLAIPIVVCSAYVTPEANRCLKLFDRLEVVTKPFKPHTLKKVIARLLKVASKDHPRPTDRKS